MKLNRQNLAALDRAIREGNSGLVRQTLQKTKLSHIARTHLTEFAKLCRRVGLAELAVTALFPLVRQKKGALALPPQPAELLEYALDLNHLGAAEEAEVILASLPEKTPGLPMARASCAVTQWDYSAAIPLFLQALEENREGPYQNLVIRVNLGAAYLAREQYAEADHWLNSAIEECRRDQHRLLLGAVLPLTVQSAVLRKSWAEVKRRVTETRAQFGGASERSQLVLDKWELFARLFEEGLDRARHRDLDRLRQRATAEGHWETLRECDRYEAIFGKSPRMIGRLYYGTPWKAYREKLLASFSVPDPFDWTFSGKTQLTLRRRDGCDERGRPKFKVGQLLHRVLLALSSDLYRPQRIAPLHHQLYPDEYFNPLSSPNRVHQALFRFRRECVRKGVPLNVEAVDELYWLRGDRLALRFERELPLSMNELRLEKWRTRFGAKPFGCGEAASAIGVSRSSCLFALREGVARGWLQTEGKGPSAVYRFGAPSNAPASDLNPLEKIKWPSRK